MTKQLEGKEICKKWKQLVDVIVDSVELFLPTHLRQRLLKSGLDLQKALDKIINAKKQLSPNVPRHFCKRVEKFKMDFQDCLNEIVKGKMQKFQVLK